MNACLEGRARKSGDRRFAEPGDTAKDDRSGLPSLVMEMAATKGVLPAAPRRMFRRGLPPR